MHTKSLDHKAIIRRTYAAFIATIILGGFNAIAIHYVVAEVPPFWGATLRFAPAAALLFLFALVRRLPLPRGRALLGAVIYGVLQFGVTFALTFWSMQTVSADFVQVIRALVPLLTLLFAILHRQESFRWRALFGSLLALGGIAIIFIDHLTPIVSLLPLLAVILGGASIAESSVIIKIFSQNNFVTTNAVGMTVGSALQFTLSLIFREPHPLPTLPATRLALAYNILVGSVIVFSLALYLLKYWPASSTSYVFVLMPFVTVLTSTLIGQDTLTPAFLTGGAVILLGVYIGALRRQKSKPVLPAEHSGFPLKAQPECE